MANPQKENGHVQIATELLSALIKAGLNGSETKMVLTIIRKTYGFNKKADCISYSQFQEYMNTCRSVVHDCVKSLVAKNLLVVVKRLPANEYSLNKDYDTWLVGKSILVAKQDKGSSQQRTELVANSGYTIDNLQKTVTKDSKINKSFKCKTCFELNGKHASFCEDPIV